MTEATMALTDLAEKGPDVDVLRRMIQLVAQRRTDVVGIFPNEAAITRLIGALLLEQNDEWQLQRRYMQLEGLQQLADSQSARAVRRDQLSTHGST